MLGISDRTFEGLMIDELKGEGLPRARASEASERAIGSPNTPLRRVPKRQNREDRQPVVGSSARSIATPLAHDGLIIGSLHRSIKEAPPLMTLQLIAPAHLLFCSRRSPVRSLGRIAND